MKHLSAYLLLCISFISGCTSMSTLQDARTTEKGDFTHIVAIGSIGAKVSDNGATGVTGDVGEEISIPMVEYMGRYGLTDKWDLGIRTTGLTYGIDTKYNLIGGGNFALSLGLGYYQLSYEIGTGASTAKYVSKDLIFPIYMNFEFNKDSLFYLVPKYITRSITATGSDSVSINFIGGTIGYRFKKVFLEYTVLNGKIEDESFSISQSAIGLKF